MPHYVSKCNPIRVGQDGPRLHTVEAFLDKLWVDPFIGVEGKTILSCASVNTHVPCACGTMVLLVDYLYLVYLFQ